MFKCMMTKMTEQDDYKDGCIPETFEDHGLVGPGFQSPTLEGLMKLVEACFPIGIEFDADMDSPTLQRLENEDGDPLNAKEQEAWMLGMRRAWLATYTFYFTEVITNEVDAKLVREALAPHKEVSNG